MKTPFSFPVILLAAGQSRRMQGRDKVLEEVEGMPLLRRQALMARGVTAGDVIVALPPPPHPRYDVLAGIDLLCLPVMKAAEGMNASLRTAIAALPPGAPCAMLVLGDLPELTLDDLKTVAQSVDLKAQMLIWRGATQEGKPGHPVVFHRDLFPAFADLTGDSGGRELVARAGDRVQLIPLPGNRARADLDTPEAWAAWRKKQAKSRNL
ncbi:MAG: nucleotidyltransferase family protein [Sulfitobacter sp.]|nr:nucleotidyltransferase family protein [Sulfitobacter sp.]